MNFDRSAIFTGGLRTVFGRAGKGVYANVRPDDLLTALFLENRRRFNKLWSGSPEDVVVGCAYPEGEQGYNIARIAALGSGLDCPGVTVNRLCGSSLEAVAIAASRIHAGYGDRYLVGGIESMSRVTRRGAGFTESEKVKKVSPTAYISMGETAENVAKQQPSISRKAQESFSIRSHELAEKAYQDGFYQSHVVALPGLADQNSPSKDEGIRYPVDPAKIAALKPAFVESGVVTAATSSPLSDGATSGWVISNEEAEKFGVKNGLKILDVTWSHVAPEVMGLGPIPAIESLFKRNGLTPQQVDAFEINEAFAIQVLACVKELNLSLDRVNTCGGAIAIGHPLGASGLRLLMTLERRLSVAGRLGGKGIAALCIGGGQGMAVLVEWSKFS